VLWRRCDRGLPRAAAPLGPAGALRVACPGSVPRKPNGLTTRNATRPFALKRAPGRPTFKLSIPVEHNVEVHMKKLTLASAVLAALAFSGTAFGQGYVGGSFGQSDFKVEWDTGYKLFGGYMFSPYFGVEGAWVDLGKAKESASGTFLFDINGTPTTVTGTLSASLKASGFALYGVGAYPIGDFALFGKLGMASIKAKSEACATLTAPVIGSACDSESKTASDFAWGLGASYHFTKNLGARLEFERFRGKFTDGDKFDIDLLSLGLQYRF
jgi:OmpA-OmpF porin, OOP family